MINLCRILKLIYLSYIAKVQEQVRSVFKSASHVQTSDHNMRSNASTSIIAVNAQFEEGISHVYAMLIDSQLTGDLKNEDDARIILKVTYLLDQLFTFVVSNLS